MAPKSYYQPVTQTPRSSSANVDSNVAPKNITSSPLSMPSLQPGKLTDSITTFADATTVALDPQRNKIAANISNSLNTINPALRGTVASLNSLSQATGGGLGSIAGKIPALDSVLSTSLAGLSVLETAGKISSITGLSGNFAGNIGAIKNPLSDTARILGVNLNNNLSNQVNNVTGNLLGGSSSIVGNLNRINSSLSNLKPGGGISNLSNVNNALISANNIAGVFGSKNAKLTNLTNTIGQISNFAGQLSSLTGNLQKPLSDLLQIDRSNKFFTGLTDIIEGADSFIELFNNPMSMTDDLANLGIPMQGNKLKNPLRVHSIYNYRITLGVLSPEEYNNASKYKTDGFESVIIRSGGGTDRRVLTTAEAEQLNGHAEYFIDDLEIDSVIAPNSKTGVSLGTTINFTVTEPYSMGKFLEALKITAEEKQYSSFNKIPFCLKISFEGYGPSGEKIKAPGVIDKYIPIMIINTDFDVTESGSVYGVKAVAYSEIAFEDAINTTKTDVNASGRTAAEVLETSNKSITRNINEHIEKLEESKKIKGYDRYLILFPKEKDSVIQAYNNYNGIKTNHNALMIDAGKQYQTERGGQDNNPNAPEKIPLVKSDVKFFNAPPIYSSLRAWGLNEDNVNELGRSKVLGDPTKSNDSSNASPAAVSIGPNDPDAAREKFIMFQNAAELQTATTSNLFTYPQQSKITQIIEDVMLDTDYCQKAPQETNDGKKKWFIIEPMVFIEYDTDIEKSIGRHRMTYVYCVHPYLPDEAKTLAPGESPMNTKKLRDSAVKEYDYIYTGKNEDIIDFNLNFNNAFVNNVLSDVGSGYDNTNKLSIAPGIVSNPQIAENISGIENSDDYDSGAISLMARNTHQFLNGSYSKTTARRIAETFHNRIINSEIEMISATMEIWGDPFYLPTDQGNYKSGFLSPNVSKDGTVEYLNNEVICIINFKTPIDYPKEMGNFVMNMPELVKPFSGLFQVLGVSNSFSGGEFKQNLKLIRRANQTTEGEGSSGHYYGNLYQEDRTNGNDASDNIGARATNNLNLAAASTSSELAINQNAYISASGVDQNYQYSDAYLKRQAKKSLNSAFGGRNPSEGSTTTVGNKHTPTNNVRSVSPINARAAVNNLGDQAFLANKTPEYGEKFLDTVEEFRPNVRDKWSIGKNASGKTIWIRADEP